MGGQQVSGVMHIHVEGQTFLEKSKKITSFEAELKNKKPWIFSD